MAIVFFLVNQLHLIGTDVTVASSSVVFAKVVDNPTMVNSARRMRAFEKK